jgi:type I restriction enzyme S subunit
VINPSTELNFKDDDVVSFYPMESIGDDGTIDHTQTRSYSAVKTGYTIFQNGDVTVAKVTPCFENYKGAHMVGIASGVGFGTTELFVLRASEKVTPEYLYWLTQAQDLNNYLAGGMRGTGGLKRVVPEELKNYKLNIPTPETQKRIVSRLVEDLKKFELLKQKAVQQIELLKERRISLISNVVTGKVKI